MRLAALAVVVLSLGCGKKPPDEVATPAPSAAEPDHRAEARKRLRRVAEAIGQFEEVMHQFPAGLRGPDGTPGLSWRVQLLLWMGEEKLYEQFRTKEAWDSPHNKALIEKMPAVFAPPGKDAGPGMTYLRSFVGDYAMIPPAPPAWKVAPPANQTGGPGSGLRGRGHGGTMGNVVSDGASSTLYAAEAAEPVVWTKPDELPYPGDLFFKKDKPPLPKLGGVFPDGFHAITCDGAVHFVPSTASDALVRGLITFKGGEDIAAEWSKTQYPNGKPPEVPTAVPDSYPDAPARRTAADRLRALADGMRRYEQATHQLPAGVAGPDGNAGLSWRVQLLPHLGHNDLYKQFKLDEAWDGPTNKPLLEKMPEAFASPGKAAPAGHTFYRTTQGPDGLIATWLKRQADPGKPLQGLMRPHTSGIAYAVVVAEAADAVPWTKPDELPLDAKQPPPKLGGAFDGGFHLVTLNGAVWFLKDTYPADDLFAALARTRRTTLYLTEIRPHIGYTLPVPAPMK